MPRKVCDPGDQVAGRVGSAALAAANIERHRGGTMACLVDVFGGWQIGKLENIVTLRLCGQCISSVAVLGMKFIQNPHCK